jgi:dihydrodipicolinate synthase/N-acetylneuraminate lyase
MVENFMNALTPAEIKGNWATLLLPIQKDQSIDWACLEEEVDSLISFKVDGIYSNGTAGEFYNQTEAEYDRVSETLASRCEKAGMPFQVGASHASPVVALERVRRAAALRPSAIQVILPYITRGFSNMSLDKFMAAAGGWCPISPRLRWPYRGIDEGGIGGLRRAIADTIPEFLKDATKQNH